MQSADKLRLVTDSADTAAGQQNLISAHLDVTNGSFLFSLSLSLSLSEASNDRQRLTLICVESKEAQFDLSKSEPQLTEAPRLDRAIPDALLRLASLQIIHLSGPIWSLSKPLMFLAFLTFLFFTIMY